MDSYSICRTPVSSLALDVVVVVFTLPWPWIARIDPRLNNGTLDPLQPIHALLCHTTPYTQSIYETAYSM